MAGEDLGAMPDGEGTSGSWRGAAASAGALLATILLAALLFMVDASNAARDDALQAEHHSYDVMLLTSNVDGKIGRAESALGRYVLNPQDEDNAHVYYSEWVVAGQQIDQLQRLVSDKPQQLKRVDQLRGFYQDYGRQLGLAAAAAHQKKGLLGVSLFYQATRAPVAGSLRGALTDIADAERGDLRARMDATRRTSDRADQLTGWFGWLAVLIGLAAVVLGWLAFRALRERVEALREADSEAGRAQRLEEAVQERTRELVTANERLKAEAAERTAAEAQLRQVQKMEAIGQLTGGIAHDFNNMLAVIVGGLDLARRKLSGSKREVEFHLDNAMEGATRAAALTRRLLAFARAEPLLPVSLAPTILVENMLDLLDRSIGERIIVHTRFPEQPWHVKVDTNQLENAILNLAVNARDAMEGEGELTIAIEHCRLAAAQVGQLPAGDYVRIAVSDTGGGIAPEHLERVFEPFFTTKPVGKGTGLGLSQIFGFARQSGGDVDIRTEVGCGTTVSLYLPRSRESGEPAGEASAAASGTAAPPATGAAILVVEDDPRVSRATVGALEELGYRPIACSSGRDALDVLAHERSIELIVTDVMMPEMTGIELVRHAVALYPWIAVLFVTGYVGDAGDADGLAGYDVLRKPFTVAALAEAVAVVLARRPTESPPAARAAAGG